MEQVRKGEQLALVSAGNMLVNAIAAWELLAKKGTRVSLFSVSDWSDLHEDDIATLGEYSNVVVLEDHVVKTGLGTAVGSALAEKGCSTQLTKIGVPQYAPSGKTDTLYKYLQMDGESVARRIERVLSSVGTRV